MLWVPVQGFAVTLALGVAISMFTAITGTRAIVRTSYTAVNVLKKLSNLGKDKMRLFW